MKLKVLLDIATAPIVTGHVGEQSGQGGSLFWVAIAAVALIVSTIATLVLVIRRHNNRNDTSVNGGKS